MKEIKLIVLLVCFGIALFTSCADQREGVVNLKFTTDLTQSDLDRMQADLKPLNIDSTYDDLKFDEEGKLKMISASIDYNDNNKASFESTVLKSSDEPGFYRYFSKD